LFAYVDLYSGGIDVCEVIDGQAILFPFEVS
jgi:hypothetical protein